MIHLSAFETDTHLDVEKNNKEQTKNQIRENWVRGFNDIRHSFNVEISNMNSQSWAAFTQIARK